MNKEVGNITIENGRILFPNFSGMEKKFNPKGRRNFCAVIDDPDLAAALERDGWHVKYLQPKEEGQMPLPYLQVGVNFGVIPPRIYMICGKKKTQLDEDSVGALDFAEITNVDMVIRPYVYEIGGKEGIKGYIKNMYVTIAEDPFASKYEDPYDDEELPFD